jgi:hypothetical protein
MKTTEPKNLPTPPEHARRLVADMLANMAKLQRERKALESRR